jgi:hypothetical protein
MQNCKECGKELDNVKKVWCDEKCRNTYRMRERSEKTKAARQSKPPEKKLCPGCAEYYIPGLKTPRYCSLRCTRIQRIQWLIEHDFDVDWSYEPITCMEDLRIALRVGWRERANDE